MDPLFSEESKYADRAREITHTGEKGIRKLRRAANGLDGLIKEIEAEKAPTKTKVTTDLTGRGSSLAELKSYRTKFRAILKTIDTQFPVPEEPESP